MKTRRAISGQALVEFAFVFPLILLITVVFIDLGRIVYYHSALKNAVREGARYAVVTQYSAQWQSNIQQVVIKYAVGLPVSASNISVSCDTTLPCTGNVAIQADIQIDPMVPFMAQIIGSGNKFNVTAESKMLMTPYGSYK